MLFNIPPIFRINAKTRKTRGNIFKDYAPEQYSIVQDYELYIKDNIVFFVISKNAESIKKNFKDILKQH